MAGIQKSNRIPGSERLTRPEEIKELSQYLKETRDELDESVMSSAFINDNLEIPGRTTGRIPDVKLYGENSAVKIEGGKEHEESMVNIFPSASTKLAKLDGVSDPPVLPTEKVGLEDNRETKLDDTLIGLEDGRNIGLEDKRLDLEDNRQTELEDFIDTIEDIRETKLDNTRLDIEDKRDTRLESTRLDISDERDVELDRTRLDLEDGRDISLEDTRVDISDNRIPELDKIRIDIQDKRETKLDETRLDIEDTREVDLGNTRLDLVDDRELDLDKTRLDISDNRNIELDKTRLDISDNQKPELDKTRLDISDTREVELENEKLIISDNRNVELSDYIDLLQDTQEVGLDKTRLDISDTREIKLDNTRVNISDDQEIGLDTTRIDLTDTQEIELDNVIIKLFDDTEISLPTEKEQLPGQQKEVRLDNTRFDLKDVRVPVLDNTRLDLDDSRNAELENTRLDVEDTRETKLEDTRLDLEDISEVELENTRLDIEDTRETELEDTRLDIEDTRDIELEDTRLDLEDTREVELPNDLEDIESHQEGIDINIPESHTSSEVEGLEDFVDKISDDRETKLEDTRLDLEDTREVELLGSLEDIESHQEGIDINIPESHTNSEVEELGDFVDKLVDNRETKLEDTRLDLEDTRETKLENTRLDLEDTRDTQLEDTRLDLEDTRDTELEDTRLDLEDTRETELEDTRLDLEDTREVELEDTRLDLEDTRDTELEDTRLDLEDTRETELEDTRLDLEDTREVELGNTRLDLEDTRNTELEDFVDKLVDDRDTELEDTRLDIEDTREAELGNTRLDLEDTRDTQLEDTRLDLEDTRDPELEDFVDELVDDRDTELENILKAIPDNNNSSGWLNDSSNSVVQDIRELNDDEAYRLLLKELADSDGNLEKKIAALVSAYLSSSAIRPEKFEEYENKLWEAMLVEKDIKSVEERYSQENIDSNFNLSINDNNSKSNREKSYTRQERIIQDAAYRNSLSPEERAEYDRLYREALEHPREYIIDDLIQVSDNTNSTSNDNYVEGLVENGIDSVEKRFKGNTEFNLSINDDNSGSNREKRYTEEEKVYWNVAWNHLPPEERARYYQAYRYALEHPKEHVITDLKKRGEDFNQGAWKKEDGLYDSSLSMASNADHESFVFVGDNNNGFARNTEVLSGLADGMEQMPQYQLGGRVNWTNKYEIGTYLRSVAEQMMSNSKARGEERRLLINETLAALVSARDAAERLSKANRDRLPGDDIPILSEFMQGGLEGLVDKAIDKVHNVSSAIITGNIQSLEMNHPYNRPKTNVLGEKKETEYFERANSLPDYPQQNVTKDKNFWKRVILGSADKIKFADSYLKGNGIKTTLLDLCGKTTTGVNSVEQLQEILKSSPYITTPRKFGTSGSGQYGSYSLDTTAYWELIIEPYLDNGGNGNGGYSYLPAIEEINTINYAEHGYPTAYSKWVPVNSFELQKSKLTSKSLSLFDGEISYPVSMEFTNELRMTIVDDQYKSWRNYFQTCADVSVYNSEVHTDSYYNYSKKGDEVLEHYIPTAIDKSSFCVAFYKNITFRIRIYIMTPQYSTVKKFDLLCVLKDFAEEYTGEVDTSGTDLNVVFSIVGENPLHTAPTPEETIQKGLESLGKSIINKIIKQDSPIAQTVKSAASSAITVLAGSAIGALGRLIKKR